MKLNRSHYYLLFLLLSSCFYDFDSDNAIDYDPNWRKVGPEGGTIEFREDIFEAPYITIDVPPGALDKEIVVSVSRNIANSGYTWIGDDSLNIFGFTGFLSFEPNDLVFKKPVTVSMGYLDVEGNPLGVSWFRSKPNTDPTNRKNWEELAVEKSAVGEFHGVASFSVNQFSNYVNGNLLYYYEIFDSLNISSEEHYIESIILPTDTDLAARAITWQITEGTEWPYKGDVRGQHSVKFLVLPEIVNIGFGFFERRDMYKVYNSFENTTSNSDPTFIEIESYLKCSVEEINDCNVSENYVGISGEIYYSWLEYKSDGLQGGFTSAGITFYDVVLKNVTTGEEKILNGRIHN